MEQISELKHSIYKYITQARETDEILEDIIEDAEDEILGNIIKLIKNI